MGGLGAAARWRARFDRREAGISCRTAIVAFVAMVLTFSGSSVALAAPQAPDQAEPNVPQVVNDEGALTPDEELTLAVAVNRARATLGIEVVALALNELGGRSIDAVVATEGPPLNAGPRLTVVLVKGPPAKIEIVVSPRGAEISDPDAIAEAAAAASESLEQNPDSGVFAAGLVAMDELREVGASQNRAVETTAEISGWFFVFWAGIIILFLLLQIPIPMAKVTIEQVSDGYAYALASQFVYGIVEGSFGFPSGFFYTDESKSKAPSRVVAREAVPKGTVLTNATRSIGRFSASIGGYGWMIGWLLLACFWACLGIWMYLAEQVSKRLLRSRITANISPLKSGVGVELQFVTRGPCAHLLRRRIKSGFQPPELPARYRKLTAPYDKQEEVVA